MYSFILGIVLLLLFRLVCTSMDHLSNAVAHCCAECGGEEGVVNLKVCEACMLVKYCNAKTAKEIIGRRIKKSANNEPPSYAARRYSRTHQPRRSVQFASYQCQYN